MKRYKNKETLELPRTLVMGILSMLATLGMLPCMLTGCDGFTDVDLPVSQLTATAVFEDNATATAAMTNIYSKIRDTGLFTGLPSGLSSQLGLYADELDYYGSPENTSIIFYNNTLLPSNAGVSELWNSSYSQIYAANAVIEGVQQSSALAESDRNILKGEALFVRALVHYTLQQVYGEIPYVTGTDYQQNRVAVKLSESEIIGLVKADLDAAIAILPENYATAERVRPNKFTALALLARVNLTAGIWDEASEAASAVLNQNSLYFPEPNIDKIFLSDSPTTIWQLMPGTDGANTLEGGTFVFVSGPPPLAALSLSLVNSFESGDLRRNHWINEVSDGSQTWYYAAKYKQHLNTGVSTEYSIMFRLSEQYLIRAEARAHQGDLIGAKEDINVIRNIAGLSDTEAKESQAILAEIFTQRRLELFTEQGHRFFDLKRAGMLDAILGGIKPGWNTTDRLFPLPETELLLNPALRPQNAGY